METGRRYADVGEHVFFGILPREGIHVVRPVSSERVYHYTTAEGLSGILRSRSFRATDTRCLNDTQEFNLGRRLALDVLEQHAGLKSIRSWVEQIITTWFREAATFAVCFCTRGDLLSQWRAYGNDGRGYCLGFDLQNMQCHVDGFSDKRLVGHIAPVIYDVHQATRLLREVSEIYWEESVAPLVRNLQEKDQERMAQLTECLVDLCRAITLISGFVKDRSFHEEAEVRALVVRRLDVENIRAGQSTGFVVKSRPNRYGSFIPYVDLAFRKSLMGHSSSPELGLAEIVLSPQTHNGELAAQGVKVLLRQTGHDASSVNVHESAIRGYRT